MAGAVDGVAAGGGEGIGGTIRRWPSGGCNRKTKSRSGVTYAEVCKLALKLPAVEKSTSYGTPALKVRGKLIARLKEDRKTLVLKTTFDDRERLLAAQPDVFYLTDHYVSHPWILVRLAVVDRDFLNELIAESWRLIAPASIQKLGHGR